MSEMVERVARAISKADENDGSIVTWVSYRRTARAAIEAMREPTESMMEAGEKHIREGRFSSVNWKRMIDAALND